jgi:hypothetical protein
LVDLLFVGYFTSLYLGCCSDEAAAKLIEFLYELVEALESHYAGQLLRYAHRYDPESSPPDTQTTDPPF